MDKLAYKSGSSKILRTAEKMPKKKKKPNRGWQTFRVKNLENQDLYKSLYLTKAFI